LHLCRAVPINSKIDSVILEKKILCEKQRNFYE
jgi:hypothetical protein